MLKLMKFKNIYEYNMVDFTILPNGVTLKDGSSSTSNFYIVMMKDIIPFLDDNTKLVLNFNECLGAGSNFLKKLVEVLIEENIATKENFHHRIIIKCDNHPEILTKVKRYLSEL